jgi:uncharacterized protein YndB with AHSA1/START domain
MIDVVHEIDAIQRSLTDGRLGDADARVLTLRRTYDAPIEDVWDALTNPARIGRWFMPISGDYRVGGRYQLEGNAGGEIQACERPNRFRITWVYGDGAESGISEVEVRLSPAGEDATNFEMEHIAVVPEETWPMYGPGAVGVGWDMGLLGLGLHLATGETVADPTAWQLSDEGRDFATRSSQAWGAANVAAGADPDVAATGVANTIAFYTTDPAAVS